VLRRIQLLVRILQENVDDHTSHDQNNTHKTEQGVALFEEKKPENQGIDHLQIPERSNSAGGLCLQRTSHEQLGEIAQCAHLFIQLIKYVLKHFLTGRVAGR